MWNAILQESCDSVDEVESETCSSGETGEGSFERGCGTRDEWLDVGGKVTVVDDVSGW